MKITFEMSGGFVHLPALSRPVIIDTAQIDPQVANQLESFVRESRFFDQPARAGTTAKGAADYRTYTLTVQEFRNMLSREFGAMRRADSQVSNFSSLPTTTAYNRINSDCQPRSASLTPVMQVDSAALRAAQRALRYAAHESIVKGAKGPGSNIPGDVQRKTKRPWPLSRFSRPSPRWSGRRSAREPDGRQRRISGVT